MKEHIEERTIEFEHMMETIINEIGLTPDLVGESPVCYETSTHVYQLCYVEQKKNDVTQVPEPNVNMPLNKLASYLFGDNIYGTVVLLTSRVGENNICLPDNVTVNEFSNILYSKFVHKGIFIDTDDTIVEYDYFIHPLEYYTNDEKDYLKYKLVETDFLGFSIALFIETNPEIKKINKRATRIVGKQKIFGKVVMLNKTTHEFNDLDLDLFNKLSKLSYGSMVQRDLLPSEKKDGEKIGDLPVVMNKYWVFERRYNNYQKVCNHCKKEITLKKLVCTGCYRVIYHDVACQKNDWNSHSMECLYNK